MSIDGERVQEILEANFGQGYFAAFVAYMSEPIRGSGDVREWRFMGNLGFGGKVTWDGRRCWVSCYPEHMTPEREQLIRNANRELKELVSVHA